MKHFEYQGYLGSADVSTEDRVLVGRLLFIKDVITYSADTVPQLEAAFREAVDEYLATCLELGDEPELPCKGTFNVRVGPQIHRDAAIYARCHDQSLNDVVCDAVSQLLYAKAIEHHHFVEVKMDRTVVASGQPADKWGIAHATSAH
ncbi:MAG TPA: type II toxin-antitoxin system HicB family antitoxin [Steroidobacteraceae bacterium]|nr:type II toxin-antitoxin system HicB family antitoxin [Steroidobacteraceae bacterium]